METLAEMLARFKANGSNLVQDLAHWAEYGITTADQLGDYLDACVAREKEKARFDDDDAEGPYECAECGADDHPTSECPHAHDGQPDEAQEWHDYDPDC